MDYNKIMQAFGVQDEILICEPFGSGHINDTYRVVTKTEKGEKEYVLQRMNTQIFQNPVGLMNNIKLVTEYMREIIIKKGGDPERETLHFYPTTDGTMYYIDEEGKYWRLEDMVMRSLSYDLAANREMFASTGTAFGQFMADLADFPADQLVEVIPNFHNTRVRYQTFVSEVEANRAGRIEDCRPEIEFAMARKELAESIVKQLENNELPLRVTHNDTKINNILMDADTDQPLCIIDLDTIMPGACAYDFGDSIRFGASSALEDEKDLDKVYMKLDLFEAYTEGYMKAVGKTLTPAEAKSLAVGAMLLTYETGIRFLGDYLNGDVYFKTHRPGQNLDRARTQLKLVADMEAKFDQMQAIVDKYYKLANQ